MNKRIISEAAAVLSSVMTEKRLNTIHDNGKYGKLGGRPRKIREGNVCPYCESVILDSARNERGDYICPKCEKRSVP